MVNALKPFSVSNGVLLTRVPRFCQRRFLLRSQSVGDMRKPSVVGARRRRRSPLCPSVEVFPRQPSRAPEVAVADAVAEVKRLEAAIEVLGGDTCMQKVSRMHCAVHEPGPECFQSQSEWQPARCSSNGPRNGSSELKRC